MAALDRRISILDFVGHSWADWIDISGVNTPEGCSLDEYSKNVKRRMESMTLKKDDMSIYGFCPSHDDFFLVVCNHCGLLVKPQAFASHCERRHKLFTSSSPDRPQQGRLPPQVDSKNQEAGGLQLPYSPHQGCSKSLHQRSSPQKKSNTLPGTPPSSSCFPTRSPKDILWQRIPTPPKGPTCDKSILKNVESQIHVHEPRTYRRMNRKVLQKYCDLDKHCGVMDAERQKVCTRLLTCNIHSIHQRRQVPGRSKTFDQLVMELKMNAKSQERPSLPKEPSEFSSVHHKSPSCPIQSKPQINNSSVVRSINLSKDHKLDEEETVCSEETQVESLSASLSSEESDENREDLTHIPTSTRHPKSLSLCSFGARLLGCSVLAFDRRLLHLRSAFSDMIEQHLSNYLRKKIPQVSERHVPQTKQTAYISHEVMCSSVPCHVASSLRTTTSRQSEPRPTTLKALSKMPPKTPEVVNNGKQAMQKSFWDPQDSAIASKRRKTIRETTELSKRTSHGPVNGARSSGVKNGPSTEMKGRIKQNLSHLHSQISSSSPSDMGGFSGLSQRAFGCEKIGTGRKRKSTNASPGQKASILSSISPSHTSLNSCSVDSRASSITHSLQKKLASQKPKLLH